MHVAAVKNINQRLIPSVKHLRDSLQAKAEEWKEIVKVGRTHMQDATPITLGQEFSGYADLLDGNLERIENNMQDVYHLALGGTAVGTGINAPPGFDKKVAAEIARQTGLPFVTAPNKFAVQGSHDALVLLSASLKTLATSLFKIANDIRILSSGPRCGQMNLISRLMNPGLPSCPGRLIHPNVTFGHGGHSGDG